MHAPLGADQSGDLPERVPPLLLSALEREGKAAPLRPPDQGRPALPLPRVRLGLVHPEQAPAESLCQVYLPALGRRHPAREDAEAWTRRLSPRTARVLDYVIAGLAVVATLWFLAQWRVWVSLY